MARPVAKTERAEEPVSIPIAAVTPVPAAETAPAPAITDDVPPVVAPEPGVDPASVERIVVFALGRPLIVELRLAIDGQPHTAALERLVDEVLSLGDTDGDGRTTWEELCASKRIKYGQYGNLAIDNENSEKQIIERYDIARDGIVDRQELPRFLTRNAGGSRPFSVRGTFNYRHASRRSAPTWKAIDADEDGRLSAEEMTSAGVRLAGHDADDDEILLETDLSPRALPPEMMAMMERRRGLEAARLLGESAKWTSVQQTMEHHYGGGRFLRTGAFHDGADLFATLDANNDGRLGRDEYQRLEEVPADVVVNIVFGNADPTEQPRLTLVKANLPTASASGSGSDVVEQSGRLTLALGGALVTFFANDAVTRDAFGERATQSLAMFDQNKDGYLERSELPESLQGQLGRFEAVDADEDGKVFAPEIEAFLAQQQAGLRAQIHSRVTDVEDVLFVLLDVDGDRRLTSRELQGTGARLAALDHDHSGDVTADEVPEVLRVALARGSIETPEATFALPPAVGRSPDKDAPPWFAAMDANQDGAVSRREFLGTAEQFAKLDTNGDELLQAQEATQATREQP